MNLTKKICVLLVTLSAGVSFLALPADAAIVTSSDKSQYVHSDCEPGVSVRILADYRSKGYTGVLDLGTYDKVDDKLCLEDANKNFDGHAKKKDLEMGCTCYMKKIKENGEKSLVMGRNLDLPNSPYPAYVFRINEPGKFRSVNIGYFSSGTEPFAQIAEDGAIIKKMYDVLPYKVTDTMNEKGLIIEVNMRNDTDAVKVTGTNPGKLRLPSCVVSRYLSDYAADITEALKLLKNLDIYSPKSEHINWHFALAMMDVTGRYGVLEFVDNRPVWHEGQKGQTNFWINRRAYQKSDANIGLGRYAVMEKRDKYIQSQDSMMKAMKHLWYSQLFSVEEDKMTFDSRTEHVGLVLDNELARIRGWIQNYGIRMDSTELYKIEKLAKLHKAPLTTSFVLDKNNAEAVANFTNAMTHAVMQLPQDVRQNSGMQEVSAVSYVIDNREKVYHVQFFEQPEVFHIGL